MNLPKIIKEGYTGASYYTMEDQLFESRRIACFGEIDEEMANQLNMQLIYLDSISPGEPITLLINSPGGHVVSGLSIYDVMKAIESPVNTVCVGTAASMASILFSSGDNRFILPNSEVMIHQPLGGAQGQATDVAIRAEWLMKTKTKMTRMMADMTGQDIEKVKADVERDYFMTAQEALDYHIIDEIYQPRK